MKHFKFLVINIIAFSSLFFLLSLLFPGQVVTAKTMTLYTSKEKVLAKLKDVPHWKDWNAFVNGNTVQRDGGNNPDTMGFSFSNNNGELLHAQFSIHEDPTNTVLFNWALIEKLPWYMPWRKFRAMVVNKEMAAIMDSSLNNFKVQLEAAK